MVGKLTDNRFVSGSEIPVLMNKSPYKSRNNLLNDKLSYRGVEGFTREEYVAGEPAEWGNLLEGLVLVKCAALLGLPDIDTEINRVYTFKKDFLECSLDGIVKNGVKTLTPSEKIIFPQGQKSIKLIGDGDIESKCTQATFSLEPAAYRGPWQLQAQMLCTGHTWGAIPTLYNGNRLVVYVYEADVSMQAHIIDALEDFYERLEGPDWYPALDGPDAALAYATAEPDLPEINLGSISDVVEEFVETKKAIKSMQSLAALLEANIMDEMGNHERAYLDDKLGNRMCEIVWRMRKTKAQPEKVTPARFEKIERQKSLSIAPKWLS